MTKNQREKIDNFLLPNSPTFIVASDSTEARIFLTKSRFGTWTEIAVLANPDAAIRQSERVTDRLGRVFDSFGSGRHAIAPKETGLQHEVDHFAHQVGSYLNKAMNTGEFDNLVLIAEPTFLGYLRQTLSTATRRSLCFERPLNPTGYDKKKLKSLFT
jgi:protein required for attachment to host cells